MTRKNTAPPSTGNRYVVFQGSLAIWQSTTSTVFDLEAGVASFRLKQDDGKITGILAAFGVGAWTRVLWTNADVEVAE